MRILLCVSALFAFACGNGVDRWDGEGCQPACVVVGVGGDNDTDLRTACLNKDDKADQCVRDGISNVVCQNAGDVVTCDTDDGLPRCLGGEIERPLCTR